MSSSYAWLALRLEGPLQSWGFESQYNRRGTGLMPTKSSIAGICCAARGCRRGSHEEREFLDAFGQLHMLAMALPRRVNGKDVGVRRLLDYHTVQNTRKADGSIKDCHITRREYLTDISFGVVLRGEGTFVRNVALALENPTWGIWLGRKTCVPTAPVFAGVFESQDDATCVLVGDRELKALSRQEDVSAFVDGLDTLNDRAVCFDADKREFAPRRIRILPGA